MTISWMAAADYHSVSSPLKGAKHESRIDTARARHAYYLDVCRITEPVVSGKIRAGIRAPVAAKRNDQWSKFVHLHIASTSAMICCTEKPKRSIAPDGQATVHAPQPWQTASLTRAILRF